jgi:DNA-binding winged helix-turn-helix (wHTH) protein
LTVGPADVLIGKNMSELPFNSLANRLLSDLASGDSVAVTGLSNTGKSTLLRALSSSLAADRYRQLSDRDGHLIYIDCNHAVALSAQAFYEVVLRGLLEQLAKKVDPELLSALRAYHEAITETPSAFAASLSFNHALSDLCEGLEHNLCLLLDEFDEIYVALDERALLNLRAQKDRFVERLVFATGTIRRLPELRGQAFEGEFAEIFARHTYPMPLLEETDVEKILKQDHWAKVANNQHPLAFQYSGGHPGLLIAILEALVSHESVGEDEWGQLLSQNPQVRAECLKMWSQLTEVEQEWLTSLVLEADAGLPRQHLNRLERLGVVKNGQIFSPLFADFVGRRGRTAEVDAQGVYLDADSGDVWVEGVRVPVLTDLEYRLLELLYERCDKLTDKYRIVTAVWGEDYLGEVDDSRVEKLVSRLRSKIEPDPSNPCYLITQRGRGYKLLSTPMQNE